MRAIAVTLFPLPLSPTIARVSPFSTLKLTDRTAGMSPSSDRKLIVRSLTSSICLD